MKHFVPLLTVIILICLAVAGFAADPAAVAPVAAQPAAVATPVPSFVAWFRLYLPIILGVALAISEGLAVLPQFQGNGLLDTIIKSLKALTGKPSDRV